MTGFRFDTSEAKKKFNLVKEHLQAEIFWPDLLDFVRKTLNRCVKTTPARDYQTIKDNQSRQYDNRVNYIPSNHGQADPLLIINEQGMHWLKYSGKWYNCSQWQLPSGIWGIYQQLLEERQRRESTSKSTFIQQRAQARFLYKKSWTQVGESIGLDVTASESVQKSLTRRKPAKNPKAGYAQMRGGKTTISVIIKNPFLDEQTAYWSGDGSKILSAAAEQGKPQFQRVVERKLNRAIFAIFKKYG